MSWLARRRIVYVDGDALANIELVAEDSLPKETGGIIIGYRVNNCVVVKSFLEIPDKEASGSSYRRLHWAAEEALQKTLSTNSRESKLGYVGEWHSHSLPSNMSAKDILELRGIATKVHASICLLMLSRASNDKWQWQAWIGRQWISYPARIKVINAEEFINPES